MLCPVTMRMEARTVSANLPETVAEGAVVLPAPLGWSTTWPAT